MASAARTPKSPEARFNLGAPLRPFRRWTRGGGYPRWRSTARGTKLGNPGWTRRRAELLWRPTARRPTATRPECSLSFSRFSPPARTLQAVAHALNARGVVHRDLIIALSVVTRRLSLPTRSRRARPHRLRDVRGQSLSGGISIWGDWSPIIGGFVDLAPNWPLYC
jgi:hypothetical protein